MKGLGKVICSNFWIFACFDFYSKSWKHALLKSFSQNNTWELTGFQEVKLHHATSTSWEPGVLRSFVWYDMGSAHSKPKPNLFRGIREILSPLTSHIIWYHLMTWMPPISTWRKTSHVQESKKVWVKKCQLAWDTLSFNNHSKPSLFTVYSPWN